MALQFALNTVDYPGMSQVIFASSDGLFDWRAQQVGGKVTIPANHTRKATRARELKGPSGKKYLIES